MRTSFLHVLALVVLLGTGCRLESHPPAGLPPDEAAIRSAASAWLAKAQPWAQLLRADIRQDRDLATAWITTSPATSEGQGERLTLLVLRRGPAGWTVEYQGTPSRSRS